MKITADVRKYAATLNDPTMSSTAEGGGGGLARSAKTEGAALSEAERGMAGMSEKFEAIGEELCVSESGKQRETID